MNVAVEHLHSIVSQIDNYSDSMVTICYECVKIVVVEADESAECEKCGRYVCPGCNGLTFCNCGYFFCEKCMEGHICEIPGVKQSQLDTDSGSEVDLCEGYDDDDISSETDEDMTEELRVYEPEEVESSDDEVEDACSSEPDELETQNVQLERVCDMNDYSDSEESE